MKLQFCLDGQDITDQVYAGVDADQVRVWTDDLVLLEVTKSAIRGHRVTTSHWHEVRLWKYSGSDSGHTYTDAQMDAEYETWQDAMHAFGIDYKKAED